MNDTTSDKCEICDKTDDLFIINNDNTVFCIECAVETNNADIAEHNDHSND